MERRRSTSRPRSRHRLPSTRKPGGASEDGAASSRSIRSSCTTAVSTSGSSVPVRWQWAAIDRVARSRVRRPIGCCRRPRCASASWAAGEGCRIRRPTGRTCNCARRRSPTPETTAAASRPLTPASAATSGSTAASAPGTDRSWDGAGAEGRGRRWRQCGWCRRRVGRCRRGVSPGSRQCVRFTPGRAGSAGGRPLVTRSGVGSTSRVRAGGRLIRGLARLVGLAATCRSRPRIVPGAPGSVPPVARRDRRAGTGWPRTAPATVRRRTTAGGRSRTGCHPAPPPPSGPTVVARRRESAGRQPGSSRSGPPVRRSGFAAAIFRQSRPSP